MFGESAQSSGGDQFSGFGMSAAPAVQFAPASDCDGEKFQTLWMQLPDSGLVNLTIRANWNCNIAEIEAKMKEVNIFTMASGLVGDEIKFYFHA
jgi:hypothetical protein